MRADFRVVDSNVESSDGRHRINGHRRLSLSHRTSRESCQQRRGRREWKRIYGCRADRCDSTAPSCHIGCTVMFTTSPQLCYEYSFIAGHSKHNVAAVAGKKILRPGIWGFSGIIRVTNCDDIWRTSTASHTTLVDHFFSHIAYSKQFFPETSGTDRREKPCTCRPDRCDRTT